MIVIFNIFSDAIVSQVLDELGLQMADQLSGKAWINILFATF